MHEKRLKAFAAEDWKSLTSWPSSLTMRKSQGSLGVTGTSQAAPYLLVMPIQSLSAPFSCTSLIDPYPAAFCRQDQLGQP